MYYLQGMLPAALQSLCAQLLALRKEDRGLAYWTARDLFAVMRHTSWPQFAQLVQAASDYCNRKGQGPDKYFREASRAAADGDGLPLEDYRLAPYAAFLVAKHLPDHLPIVRFLLNYFPAQDRSWLGIAGRIEDWERLHARVELRQTEKDFAHAIHFMDEEGFGQIKSIGDKALFGGFNTKQMRTRLGLDQDETLSDYLPASVMRARRHAEERTIRLLEENPRRTEEELVELHRESNLEARHILWEKWISPEFIPRLPHIHLVEQHFREDLERILLQHLP
jgi:DNA-damage-inducible protein D